MRNKCALLIKKRLEFCNGLITEDDNIRSGHSMAVQGYATIQSKSSGNQLHTLMVFDGWNEYVRYLNLDFGNWTDLRGTTFNG